MSILRNLAMSAVVASSMVGEVEAKTLRQGEIVGFRGIFCENEDAARTLWKGLQQETMEVTVPCKVDAAPIKIIRQVENVGEWKIVEAETEDGAMRYIITRIPFSGRGIEAFSEEQIFETEKIEL